jgi:primosomal protein N''
MFMRRTGLTRLTNLQQGHASTQGKFGSLNGVRKTFNKHPFTHRGNSLSPVLLMINRALDPLRQACTSRIKTMAQCLEGGRIT